MITEIEIQRFKSFENVRLKLGGLNLFIGANASGKSNFFDALRVLQGIAYGFTVDEIFNGKPRSATSEIWEGIRGGTSLASFDRRDPPQEPVRFRVAVDTAGEASRYSIQVAPEKGLVLSEAFAVGPVNLVKELADKERPLELPGEDVTHVAGFSQVRSSGFDQDRPELRTKILEKLGDIRSEAGQRLILSLGNMQHLAPSPTLLRAYSQAHVARRMGEHGENFAALVGAMLADSGLGSAYLSWLVRLTPMELDQIEILKGAVGEPLFALREGDRIDPAPILSDGTLRFAAIAAAFFQPDMPSILTLEEIENGIHPSRLRLLLELLKSQSQSGRPQVFATTHSPVVLAWLEEKDYETTFLCKRDEESGASIITPLSEIPHLIDLVRKQPIGELFTEGWLEGAF